VNGTSSLSLVRIGIVAGLATCVVYPLVVIAPIPKQIAIPLIALLGPSLSVASVGLRAALRLPRDSASASLGCILNIVAGALLSAMLFVQVAVRQYATSEALPTRLVGVWLGLDVAWDVYIALGTIFFSVAMFRHPRFGAWYAVPGLAIAVVLLVLNLATFPIPPAESGGFDIGPLVGLWYLAVTIRMWRSLGWAALQVA
jgi:hypothetical protein